MQLLLMSSALFSLQRRQGGVEETFFYTAALVDGWLWMWQSVDLFSQKTWLPDLKPNLDGRGRGKL